MLQSVCVGGWGRGDQGGLFSPEAGCEGRLGPGRWCDNTPVGFSPVSPLPLCTPGSTWTPSMKDRGNSSTCNGKALCYSFGNLETKIIFLH